MGVWRFEMLKIWRADPYDERLYGVSQEDIDSWIQEEKEMIEALLPLTWHNRDPGDEQP